MIIQNLVVDKLILPELIIIGLIFGISLLDLWCKKYKNCIYLLIQFGLLGVIYRICLNFNKVQNYIPQYNSNFFKNGFMLNLEGNSLKLILVSLVFILFVYIKDNLKRNYNFYTEYFSLSLISLLGCMILVSSNTLFVFYCALEICVMPIYALIALGGNEKNLTSALKYLGLNMVFSGVLLYGLSLIYGAVGSLEFIKVINFVETQHISIVFNVGLGLVLITIFFKLYLAPLQTWVPDLYQGSPIIVIMLLATLPNIALVGAYSHLLRSFLLNYFNFNWQILLMILAILSITIGNFGAIIQTNIKRMLAYLAISHSGFMLMGLFSVNLEGIFAANVYVVSYGFMVLSILGIIILLEDQGIILEKIEDFAGISKIHPFMSIMLVVLLLAMSGIPPTAGFYSKFLIFKSLISANLSPIAVIVGLLSLVNIFYAFRIIYLMYFVESSDNYGERLGIIGSKVNSKNMHSIMQGGNFIEKINYPAIIVLLGNILWILFAGLLPI